MTPPVVVGARTSPPSAASLIVIGSSTMDVVAFAGEVAVRFDDDLHQRIARRALRRRGRALASQSQDLAVLDAGRNRHLQRSALGHGDRPRRAVDRVEKRRPRVRSAGRRPARGAPARGCGAGVRRKDRRLLASRRSPTRSRKGCPGAAGIFAIIPAVRRRFFHPRSVDLARIVALSLLGIGQQFVGGRNLLEPLLGVLVARIEVGMELLRQLPVGLADFLGVAVLATPRTS